MTRLVLPALSTGLSASAVAAWGSGWGWWPFAMMCAVWLAVLAIALERTGW